MGFVLELFQAKLEDAALRKIQRENKARFVCVTLSSFASFIVSVMFSPSLKFL